MPRKGIVAFFDILGYQNLVDNNEIEDMVKLLKSTFDTLPKRVNEHLISLVKTDQRKNNLSNILGKTERLIISDSILLAVPTDIDGIHPARIWFAFISYVSKLLRVAFEEGLPLRGAIDYGDFYINDKSFAGKPIINAYRLSNNLNFSGCAFTDAAYDKLCIDGEFKEKDVLVYWKRFVMQYYAPLTTHESKLWLVNWLNPVSDWGDDIDDVTQYIYRSFHAHNKDISSKVTPKIDNTERILRYFLINTENIKKQVATSNGVAVEKPQQGAAVGTIKPKTLKKSPTKKKLTGAK